MGQACTSVLILDHNPITRDRAARVLENGGYLATETAHAGEAFSVLGGYPEIRAVVASNQWHNGIDGIALAGTVRCFWPTVAIVLLADYVLPSDADLPLDTVVLTRPFLASELIAAVGTALRARADAAGASSDQPMTVQLPAAVPLH